jgi:hypothetical protein
MSSAKPMQKTIKGTRKWLSVKMARSLWAVLMASSSWDYSMLIDRGRVQLYLRQARRAIRRLADLLRREAALTC